ncbi:hypothetical protein [Streptomyces sp. NBC_00370]|uniref:hypothetical protein n=1 Tax=Streptomyces sp. NBC_00370 TaxID=2975728 RepID=UPI002E26A92D
MNNRQGQHLGQWNDRLQVDGLPALHSFVNGLSQDFDAVEAHNNKIKMLKRQVFGRANFDPLRKRVRLAA